MGFLTEKTISAGSMGDYTRHLYDLITNLEDKKISEFVLSHAHEVTVIATITSLSRIITSMSISFISKLSLVDSTASELFKEQIISQLKEMLEEIESVK